MSQGKNREQSGLSIIKTKYLNIFLIGFNLFQDFFLKFLARFLILMIYNKYECMSRNEKFWPH